MDIYEDIDFLDKNKNILLTKRKSDGQVFVKKYLSKIQYNIYDTLRCISCDGIPKIIDLYAEHDYYVLIEEYIKGKTLQQLIDEKQMIFTPDRVEELVIFLCKTLAPIHKAKIIHRDITASNIIYTYDNRFYLIDFGNSRTYKSHQTTDTEYIGTQDYAAPEQFGFGQSNTQTDIYSIGVLCNVLLTGGKTPHEQMYKGKLARVIKRCVAVKPKDRYHTLLGLRFSLFRAKHGIFTSPPMIVFYISTITFYLFLIIALFIYFPKAFNFDDYRKYEAVETSSPSEKADRPWEYIENSIADGEYDHAQELLDYEFSKGNCKIDYYRLLSQNYEAQQRYDDAANVIIDYIYNIRGISNVSKKDYMVHRLKYLYPSCSGNIQQSIDSLINAVK